MPFLDLSCLRYAIRNAGEIPSRNKSNKSSLGSRFSLCGGKCLFIDPKNPGLELNLQQQQITTGPRIRVRLLLVFTSLGLAVPVRYRLIPGTIPRIYRPCQSKLTLITPLNYRKANKNKQLTSSSKQENNSANDLALPGKRPDSKPRSASATFTRIPIQQPPRHRASSAASQFPSSVRSASDHDLNHPRNFNTFHPPEDISPPDTPTSLDRGVDSRGSSQISPIEEEPPQDSAEEQMEAKLASLPTSRKDARKGNFRQPSDGFSPRQFPSPQPSSHDRTRWDDFSGEPSASGKAAQVVPGSTPFASQPSQPSSKPTGNHSSRVFSWGKEQLQPKKKLAEVRSRISKQNDDAPPAAPKGTVGRTPIMDPIYEKPQAMPSSRLQSSGSSDRPRDSEDCPPNPSTRLRPSVVTTITASQDKPAGPKKYAAASKNTAPGAGANANTGTSLSDGRKSSTPPRLDLPEPELHSPLSELKLATATDTASSSNNRAQPDRSELPVSRSSAATDATPEIGTRASSPGSLAESIDNASQLDEYRANIMSRKRPVPSVVAPAKKPVTTRKPTPSQAAEDAASKGLTPCPPEQQPKDRIEALEERQKTLFRRKTNITTIIDELNQVFQPTSAAYDMSAREEVKKTVNGLNNELAEIRREEHEVGVKLLRAWKKRDDQDLYGGGTGLWVKRVTS